MTDVAVTINHINCSIVGEQTNVSLTPTNTNIQLVAGEQINVSLTPTNTNIQLVVGEQINVSLTPTNTNIQLVESLTIQGQSLPFGGTRGQYLEKTGDGESEIAWMAFNSLFSQQLPMVMFIGILMMVELLITD
jgi:hypothetical protein